MIKYFVAKVSQNENGTLLLYLWMKSNNVKGFIYTLEDTICQTLDEVYLHTTKHEAEYYLLNISDVLGRTKKPPEPDEYIIGKKLSGSKHDMETQLNNYIGVI